MARVCCCTLNARPGVRPCRAHGVSPSYPVMLDAQGSYSEGMLRGLDYLLAEAGAQGLKVGRACLCFGCLGFCGTCDRERVL